MPNLSYELSNNLVTFLKGDLRKLSAMFNIYKKHYNTLKNELVTNVLKPREYGEDTKAITKRLLTEYISLNNHLITMNETDRTIVGLLWHENIIDILSDIPKKNAIQFYNKILHIICYADYIDRVTFQKQIWQFNEMSSLIKTFHTNKMYHETFEKKPKYNPADCTVPADPPSCVEGAESAASVQLVPSHSSVLFTKEPV